MLESTMSAAAGGAGGLMGQIGDVLSAPRRFAWNALGLPDTGTELLGQTFGMDQESPWTKALGMGAEMVLDPLTYAGMLLGGPLAKLGAQGVNARRTATLGTEIEQVAAARRAAQEALTQRAALEAETATRYGGQAEYMNVFDVPSIAAGKTRPYNLVEPGLADDMLNTGMATLSPQKRVPALGLPDPELGRSLGTMGQRTFPAVEDQPYAALQKIPQNTMEGGDQLIALGQNTPFGTHAPTWGAPVQSGRAGKVLRYAEDFGPAYKNLEPLLPDEYAALQARAAPHAGYHWRKNLTPRQDELLEGWAEELAAGANATRPMPTLGMHMRDQFLPTGPLKKMVLDAPVPMARPHLLDMPIDEAFSATQTTMKDLLARRKQIQEASLANALGVRDYAQVAGGSYLGSLGLGSDR